MYKEQKKSWVKHLDFLILDLLCLGVSFYLSCLIRLGNIRKTPVFREYIRLAVVVLLMDKIGRASCRERVSTLV